jgi:small multidrug resistance pump
MKYMIALCGALVLNAVANLSMKVGTQGGGLTENGATGAIRAILGSPVLLIGLVCFACNAFLYMYALQSKTLQISIAYPIMVGGGYAIISVAAFFLPSLQERLSPGQWVGVALILVGVLTVALLTPAELTPAELTPAELAAD